MKYSVMQVNDNGSVKNMDIEVEYDLNPTDLYMFICDSDWDSAIYSVNENPIEARIWVVKREAGEFENDEIACRFLPLHSACARQPPTDLIAALIDAYPEGAASRDDNGMYPLHYACANQASAEVISLLVDTFPEANFYRAESTGMLPMHLVAQWGASSLEVVDILLRERASLACAKDNEENSPLEVALASDDYSQKEDMIHKLHEAMKQEDLNESTTSTITTTAWSKYQGQIEITDEISEEDSIPIKKSMSRMAAEIMALRAKRELIRAEAEEQVAHEWKQLRSTMRQYESELTSLSEERRNLKQNGNRSNDDSRDTGTFDSVPLTVEEKKELADLGAKNSKLASEHADVKFVYDSYAAKVKAIEGIVSELSTLTKDIVKEQQCSINRIEIMEDTAKVSSAVRQTRLEEMVQEEEVISKNMAELEKSSKERKTKAEIVMGAEEILLKKIDAILQDS